MRRIARRKYIMIIKTVPIEAFLDTASLLYSALRNMGKGQNSADSADKFLYRGKFLLLTRDSIVLSSLLLIISIYIIYLLSDDNSINKGYLQCR